MAGFLTPLDIRFIDGRKWEVLSRFEYHVGAPDSGTCVTILPGFITDFASIPRGLWNLFPPTGPYGKAAVVHDKLYQDREIFENVHKPAYFYEHPCDRKEADNIFNEAMMVLGVGTWTRRIVYAGVRIGGWIAWDKHRAAERKLLWRD